MILEELGNSISNEELSLIHQLSKGKKISKGNDLLGFPYQVLDLVRDFDPEFGLNIRVLNWFGNGLFLLIYHGLGNNLPPRPLLEMDFAFSLTESPWDYPEMILNNSVSKKTDAWHLVQSKPIVWLKELQISTAPKSTISTLQLEIRNLLEIMKLSNSEKRM